jgi:hypothetical protein
MSEITTAELRTSEAATPPASPTSKFARYRADQSFATGSTTKTLPITVHKPDRFNWFTVHPDPSYQFPAMMLDLKLERETYLVAPEIQAELDGLLSPKIIVPCLTRQGACFMWPVTAPDASGRVNTWTTTAMEAVQMATKGWVRIVADMAMGGYKIYQPQVELTPIAWPDLNPDEMLEKAFHHLQIDSIDHPRVRAILRGEA